MDWKRVFERSSRLIQKHPAGIAIVGMVLFIVILVVSLSLPGKNRRPITYFTWFGVGDAKTRTVIHYGGIHFNEFGTENEGWYWWPDILDPDPRIRDISVTGFPGHPQAQHAGIVIVEQSDPTTREMWLSVPGVDLGKEIHVRYNSQIGWKWWWTHTKTGLWDDENLRFAPSGTARFFRGVGLSMWYTFLIGLLLFSLVIGVILIPLWILLGGILLMQSSSLVLYVIGNVLTVFSLISAAVLIILLLLGSGSEAKGITAHLQNLGGGFFRIRFWKD